MNKKSIIILVLILLNIFFIIKNICLISKNSINIDYNIEEKKIGNISDQENCKINVYYPISDYPKLNDEIIKSINNYMSSFKKSISEANELPNQYFSLYILYNKYETEDYLSYVFRVSMFLGGAHPNNTIFTINYDKNNNKIINIDSLIKKNDNILNIMSSESRENLFKNPLFKDKLIYDMMLEGTDSIKENFKNFVFSKDGLIIFFEQYQVAPYSYGEFNVTIPYNKI